MLSLENKEWKEFFIGGGKGLFNVTSTLSGIDKNKLILSDNEKTPYITRTDINNGINLFIPDNQLIKYKKNEGNVITIGLDTQTVFYQYHNFFTGQNIQVMEHNLLNKYNSLFLIPLIKVQMEKFNWGGNGATLGRLAKTKIMLPVNDKPDYQYMENYTKSIMDRKIQNYKRYANNQLEKIVFKEIPKLSEVEFKSFELNKIFSKLQQGKSKGLNHLNISEKGEINYLGAKKSNNGVLAYVEENNESKKIIQAGNCIAFIRNGNGSAGYSIYKAEPFIATSDITVGYSKNLNKYIGLFITTLSDKMRGKYSFGYKRSDSRLKKEKLLLPVNSNGEPDYEYMEQYMKNIIYIKINRYLNYLENK